MLTRIYHDFWPPDGSTIGPNIVASAICGVVAYLKWVRPHLRGLHKKLDHVIKYHPDIPELPTKEGQ